MSWLLAKLEASGLPRRAQIVTCTSGQTQTTMTKGGSDIIPQGLAGWGDGIIIVMASQLALRAKNWLTAEKKTWGCSE